MDLVGDVEDLRTQALMIRDIAEVQVAKPSCPRQTQVLNFHTPQQHEIHTSIVVEWVCYLYYSNYYTSSDPDQDSHNDCVKLTLSIEAWENYGITSKVVPDKKSWNNMLLLCLKFEAVTDKRSLPAYRYPTTPNHPHEVLILSASRSNGLGQNQAVTAWLHGKLMLLH